ncbi:MAG: 4-hydroxy-3-methylbut-2-en-yl diphosphate reductase, partial [Actinomycetota bacterium]|nr:4-hydroxy-3-methylbut-2-en-yl diphosphate reductase [Actinomycetota bacterium]
MGTVTGAVVATPLAIEHRALGGPGDVRVPTAEVVTTGAGPRRSREAAATLGARPRLVAGVAGALGRGITPGDLVVADEVRGPEGRSVRLPSAPLLAAALRAAGLTVHVGPVVSAEHVVTGAERAALGRPSAAYQERSILTSGVSEGPSLTSRPALAVDTESAWLVSGEVPSAVVRAVVDTPEHPLVRPGTLTRGIAALRALRRAAPMIAAWCAALGEREVLLAE